MDAINMLPREAFSRSMLRSHIRPMKHYGVFIVLDNTKAFRHHLVLKTSPYGIYCQMMKELIYNYRLNEDSDKVFYSVHKPNSLNDTTQNSLLKGEDTQYSSSESDEDEEETTGTYLHDNRKWIRTDLLIKDCRIENILSKDSEESSEDSDSESEEEYDSEDDVFEDQNILPTRRPDPRAPSQSGQEPWPLKGVINAFNSVVFGSSTVRVNRNNPQSNESTYPNVSEESYVDEERTFFPLTHEKSNTVGHRKDKYTQKSEIEESPDLEVPINSLDCKERNFFVVKEKNLIFHFELYQRMVLFEESKTNPDNNNNNNRFEPVIFERDTHEGFKKSKKYIDAVNYLVVSIKEMYQMDRSREIDEKLFEKLNKICDQVLKNEISPNGTKFQPDYNKQRPSKEE